MKTAKYSSKAVALTTATLLISSAVTPTVIAAETPTRVAVEDAVLFHLNYTADAVSLTAKNDDEVAEPETLEFTVPETEKSQNPVNFAGIEKEAYHLPIFADDLLTHDGEAAETRFANTGLRFTKVGGPGSIYLGAGQNDKSFTPVLNTKAANLTKDAVLPTNVFGDNLAQLVFDAPGKYKVQVEAIEVNDPASLATDPVPTSAVTRTSAPKIYTFLVGTAGLTDQSDPFANQADNAADPADTEVPGDPMNPDPAATPDNSDSATPADQPAEGDKPSEGEKPAEGPKPAEGEKPAANKPAPKPQLPAPNAPVNAPKGGNPVATALQSFLANPTCFSSFEGGEGALTIVPKVKDDRVSPSKWYKFNEISFTIGEAGVAKLPAAIGSIPAGSKVWMIGSTQQSGVPWVGANTMSDTVMNETTGEVTWTLSSFSGPGAMEVFTSGNFGTLVGQKWFSANSNTGSGTVTIPKNTHIHPNWVFSAPGIYRVGITQTATLKDGTQVSGTDTLFFQVGAGNGARDGHFDVGSEIAKAGAKRVWKDANGQPCTPTEADLRHAGLGNLANTGSSPLTIPLAIFAFGLGVFGFALRLRPRREA